MKSSLLLTGIELEVMKVLWGKEEPLTIVEISQHLEEKGISTASVAQAIKNLLKKNAVEVRASVPVANVYARTFAASFDRNEFLALEFERLQKNIFGHEKADMGAVVANFLTLNKKVDLAQIKELQKIIDESIEKLGEEE